MMKYIKFLAITKVLFVYKSIKEWRKIKEN